MTFNRRLRMTFAVPTLLLGACGQHRHPSAPTSPIVMPATAQAATSKGTITEPTTAPARRAPVVSPQLTADGNVTFRFRSPSAQKVEVWGDWPKPNGGALARGVDGVWTATIGPIPVGIWAYNFKIDDDYSIADPANAALKASREPTSSVLDIRGPQPSVWDRRADVPHGVIRLHDYDSAALGRVRRVRVYTPPGYDADPAVRFPVLYLLHGSGDDEKTWSEFGRANVIADNLIADKKAKPMVIVMTDGHAVGGGEAGLRGSNLEAFSRDLLGDVMPLVESAYRVRTDRDGRAIAGLSMGGNQSLVIGLRDTNRFGWIVGMSSAMREPEKELGAFLAAPATAGPPPRLLWIACGTEDFLLKENRHFDALLTERHVAHEYVESPGTHRWSVWRDNLIAFLPRLFVERP